VGGEWVAPTGDEGQDVINPATGEAIARVGFSSASDVDEAVQTGLTAFESWGERSVEERI
jgi:malonate-semialdehyde dehydrogenase (acetylating)/methylmalonate-semialdehyde dehydrogenase